MSSFVTYARAIVLVPELANLPQAQVEAYLEAACESIEEACGRGFECKYVNEETARPNQHGRSWLWRVPVDPIDVIVTDNAGTPISFLLENERGELITPSILAGDVAKVSYTGGMGTIPPSVELAVSNLAKRRITQSSSQGAITSKEIGSVKIDYEARTETAVIDPDIMASIKKYVRRGLAC